MLKFVPDYLRTKKILKYSVNTLSVKICSRKIQVSTNV